MEEKGDDLYRLKGVLSVNDACGRYVIQVYSIILIAFDYL